MCQFFWQDGYSFGLGSACAFDNKWEPADRFPVSDFTGI